MLLDRIRLEAGSVFYRIENADGKVWLMPLKNMQVAMNLYQPSGIKGKLLKAFFPYVHGCSWVQQVVHARKITCGLHEKLCRILCDSFGQDKLEFAVFGGTPCVHQKVTIQVSVGKRILGYVKVTDSSEIQGLFVREQQLLEDLQKVGVKGIPNSLFCGEVDRDMFAFVQTTVKTSDSQVPHRWGEQQEDFLKELEAATRRRMRFEESDYYRTLKSLLAHMDWLPASVDASWVNSMVSNLLTRYCGQWVEYSAYHADFTPWNMFIESGQLFVFDWEYAQRSYPPCLDKYHFFTQTAIFEKHWEAAQVIRYLQSEEGKWMDRERYVLYLVDMIARFILRERGSISRGMQASFDLWFELLQKLQK